MGLEDVLDALLDRTEGQDRIRVDDLLTTFGQRAYGPLILVPALLLTLPTGALPGIPIVLGALIALVAFEILLGRKRPFLPHIFRKVSMSRKGIESGCRKAAGVLRLMDRLAAPRLPLFVRPPFLQLAALACIGLTLLLIPVEIIPFATAIPGAALILIGLALTADDGAMMLAGLLATAAAGLGIYLLGVQTGLL